MPKRVEKCVKSVKKTIKPKKKNQSKESAAWAVCKAADKKRKKK